MKNLFEPETVEELIRRMNGMRSNSVREWGTMNAAQALAHCSAAMEVAVGDKFPRRMLLGRLVGRMAKPILTNEKQMQRNSPTDKSFLVKDQRDFAVERERLRRLIKRFAEAGPEGCTKHPHSFFGPISPEEWATGMYKHLDHHLRQFGV